MARYRKKICTICYIGLVLQCPKTLDPKTRSDTSAVVAEVVASFVMVHDWVFDFLQRQRLSHYKHYYNLPKETGLYNTSYTHDLDAPV